MGMDLDLNLIEWLMAVGAVGGVAALGWIILWCAMGEETDNEEDKEGDGV